MSELIAQLAKQIRETPDNLRGGRRNPVERLLRKIEKEHGDEVLIAALKEAHRQEGARL